jgi:hypothetical protein
MMAFQAMQVAQWLDCIQESLVTTLKSTPCLLKHRSPILYRIYYMTEEHLITSKVTVLNHSMARILLRSFAINALANSCPSRIRKIGTQQNEESKM